MIDLGEREIKLQIESKAGIIAKILASGKKDVEIRKTANGVSVAEISKKVISR